MEARLDFFGVGVAVDADGELAEWIRGDFRKYVSTAAGKPDLHFRLKYSKPEYSNLPPLAASKYHDDYIVYDSPNIRLIDFFSEALAVYRPGEQTVEITSQSKEKLYEVFQLSFESLLGEQLDRRGIHRIHCLGLEKDGKAAIILLPPGGGKTTLALRFLENGGAGVLCEDMCVKTKNRLVGLHLPFKVRDISGRYPGRIIRRNGKPYKTLIDAADLKQPTEARPAAVVLGRRTLTWDSMIKPVSRRRLLLPMFKSMVLGLELQQSLAYFLLRDYKDGFSKAGVGLSRIKAMLSILYGSRTYEFHIGLDADKNYKVLRDFVEGLR